MLSRETGQSLVPAPPHMITGVIRDAIVPRKRKSSDRRNWHIFAGRFNVI
jgi:hypothetical protein